MLLVFDIGNTSVNCGLFKGRNIVKRFRLETRLCKSTAKIAASIITGLGGLKRTGPAYRQAGINGVCIASVVPSLNKKFSDASNQNFKLKPLIVTPQNAGVKILGYNPNQVGIDRLVNAFAAYERFHKACIVVDIGTAITFDVVNSKGAFIGGAIAPGIGLSARALHEMTAKLPLVKVCRPAKIIGKNTKEAISSGLFYGSTGLIDHLVFSISKEIKTKPVVIATGGQANFLEPYTKSIKHICPDLTLEGLMLVWKKNCGTVIF